LIISSHQAGFFIYATPAVNGGMEAEKMAEVIPVTPDVNVTPAQETQPAKTEAAARFTQEDVDRILADRLKRAEDSVSKRLLEALGVDSLDTAKNALKAHQDAEESKKSAVDKAEAKAKKLEEQLAQAMEQIKSFGEKERVRTRNMAIQSALTEAKAHDVEDLLIIIENKYATEVAAVLGEDGAVNDKAIEKLMTAVKASHSKYFTPQSPGSLSNRNGVALDPQKQTREQVLAKLRAQIHL
jgi:hypothetical protein